MGKHRSGGWQLMEYNIDQISEIKIGDSLWLALDKSTGTFPEAYQPIIKKHAESINAEIRAFVSVQQGKCRLLFGEKDVRKIGIVIDNYKSERLLRILKSKGFENVTTSTFAHNLTSVFVIVPANSFEQKKREIAAIINVVEAHFKRSN